MCVFFQNNRTVWPPLLLSVPVNTFSLPPLPHKWVTARCRVPPLSALSLLAQFCARIILSDGFLMNEPLSVKAFYTWGVMWQQPNNKFTAFNIVIISISSSPTVVYVCPEGKYRTVTVNEKQQNVKKKILNQFYDMSLNIWAWKQRFLPFRNMFNKTIWGQRRKVQKLVKTTRLLEYCEF